MNISDCSNSECKILQHCKRGMKMYQGEQINFKQICNELNKFEWISLIEENNIIEGDK